MMEGNFGKPTSQAFAQKNFLKSEVVMPMTP
jgi:hypothetical protein